MPRYLKQNGKKMDNVRTEKAWIQIPLKDKGEESYLVQPRVADYIVRLEKKIKGELPKLK